MLEIDSLSIGYGENVLIREFSLRLEDGECVLLAGRNGSGKSSLLRTLAGMQRAMKGSFHCSAGSIFVPTGTIRVKGFSVLDFLNTSSARETRWGVSFDAAAAGKSFRAMELLCILELADRDISTLSDGEFQKVCVASALARLVTAGNGISAGLLLLDEPSAFLDVDASSALLETISDLAHSHGLTVLFSSHDIYAAMKYSDRVLSISSEGSVCLSGCGDREKISALGRAFKQINK